MNLTADVFDAYSRYYDLLYQDKDYDAEVIYVDRLLTGHGMTGRELLEFGSGTGRHGRLLAEKGYRVTGIERSHTMWAQATETDGFQCLHDDICTVQLNRGFDAVISLFHVISYQTDNSRVKAVFARAADHLNPGGLFVFDFWYSPAVYTLGPTVRVKRMADSTCEITRIAEPITCPNQNRVDVHYTIFVRDLITGTVRTLTETHPMRHFSLPEIDLLAESNGFMRIGAEEFLTGNPPGTDTWGVCVTLKKV
ncbi:MAG: class I SAM-dependent methyltransferase [Desulfatirhabdiaceae bacterium]